MTMNTLFIRLLNLSIAATWIILAVLLVRALARKAPKWFPCLLWALVGIRLLCPFSFQSPFSLVPSEEAIPENITEMEDPKIHTGVPFVNSAVNPVLSDATKTDPEDGSESGISLERVFSIAAYVWIGGTVLMLGYGLVSYIRLKRSLIASIPVGDGVMACDEVHSPFILGIIRPKIYVPSSLEEGAMSYVIAHEKSHLKRHDHWWKPLGFLILCVYWFHPLCWVAYILLCRDIEMACDEKVVREMEKEETANYSQTLLDLSFRKTAIAACPVAFGEIGVNQRVKNVLSYKKPGFWVIIGLIVISVAVSVLFLTNPIKTKAKASGGFIAPSEEMNMDELKEMFPNFFGLNAENGLVVYVSQFSENSYYCYLKEEGAGEPTIDECVVIRKQKPEDYTPSPQSSMLECDTTGWAYVNEMRAILIDYGISSEKVRVASFQHPLSSYIQVNDPNEGALERYEEKIRKLFFKD